MSINIISLNGHPTTILSKDTPVKIISNGGRETYVFDGEDISQYIRLQLPPTVLPVPRVGSTAPQNKTILVDGVEIDVQVSSGTQISDLPEEQGEVIYMTSYPTAKAAAELGRKDFVNSGPSVWASFNEETGKGEVMLGCLGVNTFA